MSPRRTRRGTVRESVIDVDTSLKSNSKTAKSTRRANKSQIIKIEEDSDSVVETTASSFQDNTPSNVRSRKRKGQESLLSQDSSVTVSADESKIKSSKKKIPPKSQKTRSVKAKILNSSLISEDDSFDVKAKKGGKRVSYSTDLISEDEDVPTAALKKRGRLTTQANAKVVCKTPEKLTPQKVPPNNVGSPSGRVTPKSSPIIDIPLTPHRSTKTPKKSPINLGSPKTHARNSFNLLNVSRKLSITDSPPSSGASTPQQQSDTSGNLSKTTRNKRTPKGSVAKSKISSNQKTPASPRRKVSVSPKVIVKPMKSKSRLATKKSPKKSPQKSAIIRKSVTGSHSPKTSKIASPCISEPILSNSHDASQTKSRKQLENATPLKPNTGKDASPSKSKKGRDASPSKSNEGRDASPSKSNKGRDVSPSKSNKGRDASPSKSSKRRNVSPSKSDKARDASPTKSPKSAIKSPPTKVINLSNIKVKTEASDKDHQNTGSPNHSSKSLSKSKKTSPPKGRKSSGSTAVQKNVGSPTKISPVKESKLGKKNAVASKTKKTSKSTSLQNISAAEESQNVSLTSKTETSSRISPSKSKKSPQAFSSNKSFDTSHMSSSSKSKKSSKKTVTTKAKKSSKIAFPLVSKKMPKIVLALKPKKPSKLSKTLSPTKSAKKVPKISKSLSPPKRMKTVDNVDSSVKAKHVSPKKILPKKSNTPKKSLSPRVIVNKLSSPRMKKSNSFASQNELSIKLIPVDHAAQKVRSPRSSKSPKKSPLKPVTPSAKILSSMTKNAKKLSLNPAICTPSNVLAKKFQTLKPKNTSTPRERSKKPMNSKSSPPKQSISAQVARGSQNNKSVNSKIFKSFNSHAKIKAEPQLLEDESEPSMDSSSLIHMSDVFDSDLSTKNDSHKVSRGVRSPSKGKSANTSTSRDSSKQNTSKTQNNYLKTSMKERSMNETYEVTNEKSPGASAKAIKRTANEAKVASEKETKKSCKVHFANTTAGNQNLTSRISRVGTPGHAMQRKKPTVAESKRNDSISNQSLNNKSASRRSVSVSSVRTPIPNSANLRRSMSMSESVSKPRRSTHEAQMASVNRLSRPRAIFNSEKKSLEKKETVTRTPSASSAKKIPNFAEIHQKNFAKMESLVDLKKRVEKRHVTLSAKKSGVQPSDANNGYNRFGFKLRKTDAINIISKKSGGSVDSRETKRQEARTALKGVRMNRRFELQMKARLKTS